MRCFTKRISLPLLVFLALGVSASPPPFRSGAVFGEADSVYLLSTLPGTPAPPSVTLGGFSQRVTQHGADWEITIHTRATQVGGAYTFDGPLTETLLSDFPETFRSAAFSSLRDATRADEACLKVAKLLREHLAYAPTQEVETAEPSALLRNGTASCTGFARIAALLLQGGGVSSRPVVGLTAPADGSQLTLEGGVLHVWLEISPKGGRPTYFDPVFSAGWVPSRYLVLRTGEGVEAGALRAWKGATLSRIWQRDRLFAVPDLEGETLFWRGGAPPLTPNRAMLCGKLLDGGDAPLTGTAILRGAELSLSVPLWEGNFCFQNLLPGDYELSVESSGKTCAREFVGLSSMDKRTVVFYSQRARRSSAVNGTSR